MTQNFPKLTMMTEVRKNSTETTTFSKLSARKMSKLKISAKANTPKRRFHSQKICDSEIEVSAEAEVPLLWRLQNLSQCDRALNERRTMKRRRPYKKHALNNWETISHCSTGVQLETQIKSREHAIYTSIQFKEGGSHHLNE